MMDAPEELDTNTMRALYRFGGLYTYSVMVRRAVVAHVFMQQDEEVMNTFNEERARAEAEFRGGFVVQRFVRFDGAFAARDGGAHG